ncbi:helix-turn-helix transcriptional regulator [Parabacteroides sp. PF5-6]|uniref:helix-turn-helix domain-containing protein n=1 Tax=Parabacteroides sp. PF5-6 TaxID=1742403 RepID=UPI0024066144|nr:helix-turn-helix transcriptional regulator [Parabacteroides sp. PF5-6]MDF9829332.1 transcriptional regulator with XRE-family HTH domain [Parabacteroides sp. PF5-6]
MKKANLLESRLQEVAKDVEEFVSLSFDISDRVRDILEERNISQKDFAKLLGKRESEISKWLKGTHNFTLETIAKISIALNVRLLYVPAKTKSISEIKEAIADFEILYRHKSAENNPISITFTIPDKKQIYLKEKHIGQINPEGKICFKQDLSTSKYQIACNSSSMESIRRLPDNILF